jgi:tetratricopeptide (TPR) repeat protein
LLHFAQDCEHVFSLAAEAELEGLDIGLPLERFDRLRCKTYARRGAARCWLGQLSQAKQDYSSAIELAPGNQQLKLQLESISTQLQARTFKRKAAVAYSGGHYEKSVSLYSQALEWHPKAHPSPTPLAIMRICVLLSNRAAAHLSLAEYAKCTQDSSRALMLFKSIIEHKSREGDPAALRLVRTPAALRLQKLTFLRRGAASGWEGKLELARKDYAAALKLHDDELGLCVAADQRAAHAEERNTIETDLMMIEQEEEREIDFTADEKLQRTR